MNCKSALCVALRNYHQRDIHNILSMRSIVLHDYPKYNVYSFKDLYPSYAYPEPYGYGLTFILY